MSADDPYRERIEGLVSFAAGATGTLLTSALIAYFRASLVHADRIPRAGAALVVSNHGPFGIDSVVLTSLVLRPRLHDLDVTRLSGHHHVIARVRRCAAHEARRRRDHAGHLVEIGFGAPEAAGPERRDRLTGLRDGRSSTGNDGRETEGSD